MKYIYQSLILMLILTTVFAQEPTFSPTDYRKDMLLSNEPDVIGFEGSSVIVEFDTIIDTPTSVVYYGVPHTEGYLTTPRYRKSALGTHINDKKTMHQIKIDVSKLEDVHYDTGLIEGNGGTIVYRIEVFDSRVNTTRAYDRRLRYKRDGAPKSGTYTTLTTITEGPFVDLVTHNSAVISWETENPTEGIVRIFTQDETNTLIKKEDFYSKEDTTQHEVAVTYLQPDTTYFYQVYTDGFSNTYTFKTAPIPGKASIFKFGFMSDSRAGVGGGERAQNGVNAKDLGRFATELYIKKADFVCFVGDLINGYTSDIWDYTSQLKTWKRTIQPVGALIPFYESIGNHEQVGNYYTVVTTEMKPEENYIQFSGTVAENSAENIFAEEFVNPVGSRYGFGIPNPEKKWSTDIGGSDTGPSYHENVYSFIYGRIHFISLNSNYWTTGYRNQSKFGQKSQDKDAVNLALSLFGGNREGYLMNNQVEWLKKELEEAQNDTNIDWIFIILHEPPFPNGGHVKDAMYWGTPGQGELGGYNDKDAPLGDVIDMRNRFWTVVSSKSKVLGVLCGDEHNYSRTLIDSSLNPNFQYPVWQIISGGCGAPYYVQDKSVPWVDNVKAFTIDKHFCLFSVDKEQIGLEVYNDNSQLLDSIIDLTNIR
ncbi:metallophosphoesterase family protein [Candidatus Poribacteria bacterium]|nr:metallophosphoesterase family protein [Candidatus Poribacteria bacterium]